MKVSVIVPAYNSGNYIQRTLDSIVNQIYKDLEIIIIDDASNDNTKKIIKEYSEKDNRIIPFYSTISKGVSNARNIGLKAATGEYIIFVDSDDVLTKDAIRRMVDVANKYNSDYVDSYHLLYYKKKNGKEVSFTEKKVPKNVIMLSSIEKDSELATKYMYINGKLIKRKLIGDLQFDEDLNIYEDLVFDQTLRSRAKNYVLLNKVVYLYFQREDSLVNSFGKQHLCYLDAAKKVKKISCNYNNDAKDRVDAMLFVNAILTLFSKIIKNNDSINDNLVIVKNYLNELNKLFSNYNDNKYINFFIRKAFIKYKDDDKKLEKLIIKLKNKNLVKIYFNYLAVFNKYKLNVH